MKASWDRRSYILTYIHTYILTLKVLFIQTYIHVRSYIRTYIHTNLFYPWNSMWIETRCSAARILSTRYSTLPVMPYIHTYIHTYIHSYSMYVYYATVNYYHGFSQGVEVRLDVQHHVVDSVLYIYIHVRIHIDDNINTYIYIIHTYIFTYIYVHK